tara:strand:+ start:1423 stop:1722 length:300 start_codon:yes stop_codon:yes gene_type:complete
MKVLLISALLFTMAACTTDDAAVVATVQTLVTMPVAVPAVAEPVAVPAVAEPVAEPEVAPTEKKVCHDVTTNGKVTSQCKMVKIHQKYEGTVVPKQVKK